MTRSNHNPNQPDPMTTTNTAAPVVTLHHYQAGAVRGLSAAHAALKASGPAALLPRGIRIGSPRGWASLSRIDSPEDDAPTVEHPPHVGADPVEAFLAFSLATAKGEQLAAPHSLVPAEIEPAKSDRYPDPYPATYARHVGTCTVEQLDEATRYASREPGRYAMNTVRVTPYRFTTTDGKRLFSARYAHPDGAEIDNRGALLVPLPVALAAVRGARKIGARTLRIDASTDPTRSVHVRFRAQVPSTAAAETLDVGGQVEGPEASFPDFGPVLSTAEREAPRAVTLHVGAQQLADATKRARAYTTAAAVGLELTIQDAATGTPRLVLTARHPKRGTYQEQLTLAAIVHPMAVEPAQIGALVDGRFLADACRTFLALDPLRKTRRDGTQLAIRIVGPGQGAPDDERSTGIEWTASPLTVEAGHHQATRATLRDRLVLMPLRREAAR